MIAKCEAAIRRLRMGYVKYDDWLASGAAPKNCARRDTALQSAAVHIRRVMDKLITYVGLDVHKDTIAIALAESGKRGEVREYGKIAHTSAAVQAVAIKLARDGSELRFCYEAGPCGYWIQRQLAAAKHACVVVASSLPRQWHQDRWHICHAKLRCLADQSHKPKSAPAKHPDQRSATVK